MTRTLRSDHLAGLFFVALGVAIFAVSGDLPMGTLSFPGSGFLPKIVAALLIVFGAVLGLRARESEPLNALDWSDVPHALRVIVVAAAAIALYAVAGFLVTMAAMLFVLIAVVERRGLLSAAVYSIAVTGAAYLLFDRVLKAPLPGGWLAF